MYLPFLSCECNFNSNFFLLECEKVLSSHHVVYIGFDWWVRVVFALPGYPWGGFFSTSELETVGQPWRWNYTILLYRESLFQSWQLWENPEDETIQHFFIGRAYFKVGKCRRAEDETIQHFFIGKAYCQVGNCRRAPKMKLYNTSLSGKPIL